MTQQSLKEIWLRPFCLLNLICIFDTQQFKTQDFTAFSGALGASGINIPNKIQILKNQLIIFLKHSEIEGVSYHYFESLYFILI